MDEMETRVYTSDYAFQSEVSDLSEWFMLARWIVELIVGTCWDMIVWSLNDGHYYWSEFDYIVYDN